MRPRRILRSPRPDQRGFSLVEVMVGLVLMTIGVLGMAGLTVTVTQANRGATNWTRADQVLHEKIEEFQTADYADIAAGADTTWIAGMEFARFWTVEVDTPMTGVKLIEIQGAWQEGPTSRTAHRMTFISEPGR